MAATLTVAGTFFVTSCSRDDDPQTSVPETVVTSSTDSNPVSSTPLETELPDDVTASGVLLAATLIASGRIDEAVASGLVTPAEVDEARAAIESGTLNTWVELAESR